MAIIKITEINGDRFLISDYVGADEELKKLIGLVLGSAAREAGGCIAIGEIYETYISSAGRIVLFFDEGYGYEFWADRPELHKILLRAISASPIFLLERRSRREY